MSKKTKNAKKEVSHDRRIRE